MVGEVVGATIVVFQSRVVSVAVGVMVCKVACWVAQLRRQ